MEWNEETIARLRALWAEGLSTAEIGRRLNVSKNAVVGKAHRLNLPPRPSPIRRPPPGAEPRPRPVVAPEPSLRPSVSFGQTSVGHVSSAHVSSAHVSVRPVAVADAPAAPRPAVVAPAPRRPVEAPRPVLRSVPAPAPGGRVTACCWPIGDPGTKGFHFCDAPSAPGKPYCLEHAAVAYVKVRDRREEAA